MKKTNEFDFSQFLLSYEKKIGRALTTEEINKARKIYSDLITESTKKANGLFMSEKKDTSDTVITQKFNQYENFLLTDAEKLMEQHKKIAEDSTIEIKKGKRVNLKFPGKVHIIAVDRSGEVIEINNKKDVEYNTMAYRFDTIKTQVKDTVADEIRNDMEFE